MSTRPWMPLYVGDYRADTNHLSAAQHGAYLLLIMHYWQHGRLPEDDEQLSRVACMSVAEWRKNRPVIRAFFRDGWRHDRIDREISEACDRYDRRANAGKKGNEVRWNRRNAIALGSQSQSQPQSHQNYPSQVRKNLSEGTSTTGTGTGTPPTTAVRQPRLAVVNGAAADGQEDGR